MRAICKETISRGGDVWRVGNPYSACPVVGGWQVARTPNVEWMKLTWKDVRVFSDKQFKKYFTEVK